MIDAPFLLRRYGSTALLDEHRQWEALRLSASRYAPVRDNSRPKTLAVLDGIPGAGKSTTRKWLEPALGAEFFTMARFAEARGVDSQERLQHQLATQRPHPVDVAFLEALTASNARYLMLEKFPRSTVEAAALLEHAHAHHWNIHVLHLDLPGDWVELSVARQIARGPRRGQIPDVEHARHRALAHTARTTSARSFLSEHGVPIHRFDMTRPAVDVRADIRRALGIETTALRWHQPTLEVLEAVSGALGIEAYLANGSFYRPFWNDRFGPMQQPSDADVAVDREWEVAPLLERLEREAPHERWSVLCPSSRLAAATGLQTTTAAEAKSLAAFMHKTGLVRRYRGEIELVMPASVEGTLWNGILQLNHNLLERLTGEQRAAWLERHANRLPGVLAAYPALTIDPLTAALLGITRGEQHEVGSGFTPLKQRTLSRRPPLRTSPCRRKLSAAELVVARDILAFHRTASRQSEAPPRPRRTAQPVARVSLVAVARDADDATFGAWLLDQQRHEPEAEVDADLHALLTLDLVPKRTRERFAAERELSPMHQGWSLERHLIESALQLETDALVTATGEPELRLCMRVAMLYHDIGKVFGTRPARHPQMSARMFAKRKPAGFPEELVPLTQWMIRTHDVFGVFTRGLTDKVGHAAGDYDVDLAAPSSYYGAIDSQAARAQLKTSGRKLSEAVAIASGLWRADIGSIASLRWLMPVTEHVERLLLLPGESFFAGVDRRTQAA